MKSNISKEDSDFVGLLDKYQNEAANNAIRAFNEGYFLGRKYAEGIFKNGEAKWKLK